jgi:hypothetical protein
LPTQVSVQPGVEPSGTESSESFSDDGLENKRRDFVACLLRELCPFLVTNARTKRGAIKVLLRASFSLDPHQLDTAVIGQGFDVITHLLHVLPNEASNLGCTRFPFIENLQSVNPDWMLHYKDHELIDSPCFHRCISHDKPTSSRYSIAE